MPLVPGMQLGPYQITAPLGAALEELNPERQHFDSRPWKTRSRNGTLG
jgi:hypothetical protein